MLAGSMGQLPPAGKSFSIPCPRLRVRVRDMVMGTELLRSVSQLILCREGRLKKNHEQVL